MYVHGEWWTLQDMQIGEKSSWEERENQSQGEGIQTARLLLWIPRTLFHTVTDSFKEIHRCRTTSEFHYKGKKKIFKFKIKGGADLDHICV